MSSFLYDQKRGFYLKTPVRQGEQEDLSIWIEGENRPVRWVSGANLVEWRSADRWAIWTGFKPTSKGWFGEIQIPDSVGGPFKNYPVSLPIEFRAPIFEKSGSTSLSGNRLGATPFNLGDDLRAGTLHGDWMTLSHRSRFTWNVWIQISEIPVFRVVSQVGQWAYGLRGAEWLKRGSFYMTAELPANRLRVGRQSGSGEMRFQDQAITTQWISVTIDPGERVRFQLGLSAPSGLPIPWWRHGPTDLEFSPQCLGVLGASFCRYQVTSIDVRSRMFSQVIAAPGDLGLPEVQQVLRSKTPANVTAILGENGPVETSWKLFIGKSQYRFSDDEWNLASPQYQWLPQGVTSDGRTDLETTYADE